MKKILIVLLVTSYLNVFAQNTNNITFSVAKQPKSQLGFLDNNQINRLENKIIQGITKNGYGAINVKNNIFSFFNVSKNGSIT